MVTLPRGTFYGREERRREVAGLVLTETAYRPGDALPEHDHCRAYFCLIVAGGFQERDGRRARDCAPATVLFHPPGAAHSDRFGSEPTRCFNLELGEPWLERMSDGGSGMPAGSEMFRRRRANWFARHLYDAFRAHGPGDGLAIEGLALALLSEVVRLDGGAETVPPPWIGQAVEILHAAPGGASPGLSEIAERVGVHPVHLARVFRRHHGCSIGAYARRLRLERATRTLLESDATIGRLAHRLGYADHSHFARSFRRATGLSPSEYRRRHGFADTGPASPDQEGGRRRG